jgi:hypothetical protein
MKAVHCGETEMFSRSGIDVSAPVDGHFAAARQSCLYTQYVDPPLAFYGGMGATREQQLADAQQMLASSAAALGGNLIEAGHEARMSPSETRCLGYPLSFLAVRHVAKKLSEPIRRRRSANRHKADATAIQRRMASKMFVGGTRGGEFDRDDPFCI